MDSSNITIGTASDHLQSEEEVSESPTVGSGSSSNNGIEEETNKAEQEHHLKTVAVGLPAHEDDGDIVKEALKINDSIDKKEKNASVPHPPTDTSTPPPSKTTAAASSSSSALGLVEHEANVLQKCNIIKTPNKEGEKQEEPKKVVGSTAATEGKDDITTTNEATTTSSQGTPGAFRVNLADGGSSSEQPEEANASTTTRIINDEPANLVTAELVNPIHAIEVTPVLSGAVSVTDPMSSHASSGVFHLDIERGRERRPSTRSIDDIRERIKDLSSGVQEDKRRNEYLLMGLLLGLVVALAIAVPVSLKMTNSDNNDSNNDNEVGTPPPVWHNEEEPLSITTVTPTLSPPPQLQDPQQPTPPAYDYPCFNSTDALNWATLLNPEQDVFVLCPHTNIRVGEIHTPQPNHTEFLHGDSPLAICRPNITIQCGLDGSVNNHCALEGGQTQLATLTTLSDSTATLHCPPTDHVTLRGITFTGKLSHDLFWGSKSVVLSNPAKSMKFVDCKWENMTAQSGLFHVGLNLFQELNEGGEPPLDEQSIDLQIINSTFSNIIYDGPVFRVHDQNVTISGCTFENIRLPQYINGCGNGPTDWCQGILYCWGRSHCVLEDTLVDDLAFFGNAALLTVSSDSTWRVSNVSSSASWHLHSNKQSSEGTQGLEGEICASGVGWFHNDTSVQCLELEDD